MLNDQQTIDQIVMRREASASLDAAEAADLLGYVDGARTAGERIGGEAQGRRRVDAAMHELSLAMTLPVPTVERRVARARRLRSVLPTVWQAWHDGRISTAAVESIDRAARRLVDPASVAHLDDIAVDRVGNLTPGQAVRWLDRWVERTEAQAAAARHELANADRHVAVRPAGDGMSRITAVINSVDAAAIMARLTGAAHQLPADDPRTIDQARADLLADSLLERQGGGLGYRAVIGITVPLSSLMGFSDTPGELTDRSATIPARMCDHDHSDPWPADTCAANTSPLNRRAHNLTIPEPYGEGHIKLRQPSPGTFEWTTSTGHTYTQHPEPLPIADWKAPLE